jgi:hypothetical protein
MPHLTLSEYKSLCILLWFQILTFLLESIQYNPEITTPKPCARHSSRLSRASTVPRHVSYIFMHPTGVFHSRTQRGRSTICMKKGFCESFLIILLCGWPIVTTFGKWNLWVEQFRCLGGESIFLFLVIMEFDLISKVAEVFTICKKNGWVQPKIYQACVHITLGWNFLFGGSNVNRYTACTTLSLVKWNLSSYPAAANSAFALSSIIRWRKSAAYLYQKALIYHHTSITWFNMM